jgi:hypothetical protein
MADTFPVPVVEPAVEPVAPSLPFLTYDKEEFETDVGLFGGDTSAFTSSMVEVLAEDFPEQPDYMTYSGLRDGTAPILDTIPELAGLSPAERRLSDNDIIEFFARDLEGEPIQAGTFLGGAKREIIPAAASVPTFMGGFALGQTAVAGVPPVGPAAVLRFGLPFVTGTIGAGLGYFVGEQVNDAIQGEESPILPGTAAAYEAGKTAAGAFAWLPMPYMVPKQINFGVELAENLVKEGKKIPLSLKVARGLENTVGTMGAQARANPYKFAATETVAGAGATGGAYGVESSALEGSTTARISGEIGGSIATLLLAQRLPTTFKLLGKGYGALKEGRVQEGAVNLATAFKGKRETQVTNYILDLLEESGEDTEAVIAALSSKEFESLLMDDSGKPIALTAALKSGSPTLAALEKSLEQMAVGLSKERNSANVQADRALRNTIVALYGTGDKAAIQEGALLAQAVFDADLENNLLGAMNEVLTAFDKVAGKRGPDWAAERQATLGRKLYEVIDARFKAGRAQERTLWRNTGPNLTLTEFVDADGNATNVPNFMSFYEEMLPTTEVAADFTERPLWPLKRFVAQKRKELFPDSATVDEYVASPRLVKAQDRLEDSLDAISGVTYNVDRFNSIRDQASQIADIDERVTFLRQRASIIRREAADAEDKLIERRTAKAVDELADVERLTARDAAREAERVQVPGEIDGTISISELTEMRTVALNLGKTLAAAGDSSSARIAYGFAEALMRDLESFPQGVDPAYDTARAYSRAFNDAYTRTFAGDVLGVSKTGAPKVAPEQIANDIFNADAGYLRSLQLDGLGKFELTQSLTNLAGNAKGELKPLLDDMMSTVINKDNDMIDTKKLTDWISENSDALAQFPQARDNVLQAANTTTTVRGTTEAILRNIRASDRMFNPETGVLNVNSLKAWMAKPENVDVLNAMPALKADLEDSIKANLLLKEGTVANKEAQKELNGQISFMDLLPNTTENPATAFARAFNKNNKSPIKSLNKLWEVVQKAPESWTDATGVTRTKEEALEGFKSSLIESLYTRNGQTSNSFSPKGLYEAIFLPHPNSPGKITLAEWLVEKEVMPKVEVDRLKRITSEMVKMESFTMKDGVDLGDLAETVGPMMDFYLRIVGSSIGTRAQSLIPGDSAGGSLVAASAGSKAFRTAYSKVFANIPESMKMDVMTQMMRDPELLAVMLKKGRTENERGSIFKRLTTLLTEKGLISGVEAAANVGRRAIPSVTREGVFEDTEGQTPPQSSPFFIQNVLPSNDQQGAVAPPPRPPVQRPSPVGPPTTQASAVPSPSPDPAPVNSGPVDRTRYAALFPNDMASGMIRQSQGIGSLI